MRRRFASLVAALGTVCAIASSSDAHAQSVTSDPASGLALFGASYVYAAVMGTAVYRSESGRPLWESLIPVAGPYIAMKSLSTDSMLGPRIGGSGSLNSPGFVTGAVFAGMEMVVFALDPIWQAVGLATAMAGLAPRPRLGRASLSSPTLAFSAMPMRGGGGRFTVSVASW